MKPLKNTEEYDIVQDEPEEMTLEEVCKEIGRVIKIKK